MANLAHPELSPFDPRNDTPAERRHKWKVFAICATIFILGLLAVIIRSHG